MQLSRSIASLVFSGLILTACGDGVLDLDIPEQLTPVEVAVVADEVAALAYGTVDGEAPGAVQTAASTSPGSIRVEGRSFSGAFECAMGGVVEFAGSAQGEIDLARLSASLHVTATKVHRDCAFDTGDAVVTLNGDPHLTVQSTLAKMAGVPLGFQSVELSGAVSWGTDDGRTGQCAVDLHVVLDPGPRTRTTTGALCGQDVLVVEDWSSAG